MITLLATLAWGESPPDDVEPEQRGSDGGRIAVASLSGAVVGGLGGLIIGSLIGGTMNHNVDCGTTNEDCLDAGGLLYAGAGAGLIVGGITGGIVGGVITANKLRRNRVALAPVGPGGPGLTLVGTF